jgi:hypothetical protein
VRTVRDRVNTWTYYRKPSERDRVRTSLRVILPGSQNTKWVIFDRKDAKWGPNSEILHI